MTILYQCPFCGQAYQAPPQWAGGQVQCPSCRAVMQVPGPAAPMGVPAAYPAPQAPVMYPSFPAPAPAVDDAPDSVLRRPAAWIIAGATVGVVFLLGILVLALGGGRGKGQPGDAPVAAGVPPAADPAPAAAAGGPVRTIPVASNMIAAAPASDSPAPSAKALPSATTEPNRAAPAASTTPPTSPAKPPAPGPDWGGESPLVVDSRSGVTFGPPGCPIVVSGKSVWAIAQKRNVAELDDPPESPGARAISPDGRWFAAVDRSSKPEDSGVRVWDAQSGNRRFVVPGDPQRHIELVLLTNERLYMAAAGEKALDVWDLESGQRQRVLKLPDHGIRAQSAALSPDGKFLAAVSHDRLVVLRLESGKVATTMEPPRDLDRGGPMKPPGLPRNPGGKGRAASTDAVFVYAWVQSMRFSPDGQELAAVSTHPVPRLLCWNSRGKLVFDETLCGERRVGRDHRLQWFPNRKAWLVDGDVIDREAGRIVLSIKRSFADDLRLCVVDDDHLLGTFPHNPSQLESLEIPWARIRESLALLKEGGEALLGPKQTVSVLLELGQLRGDQQETARLLQEALLKRLARDGIRGEAGRLTYFRLRFAETAGDRLPIHVRQSPFDFRGTPTGQSVTEAHGSLVVELFVEGHAEPVWRESFSAQSSRSFNETINDATVRNSMLERIAGEIEELSCPYFIPKSDNMLALPIVVGG